MNNTIKLSLISVALLSQLQAKNTVELNEITVISATKTAQSIKDVTSNISVLTGEDIEARGFSTVTDAINSMAGVSFTQSGGMGSKTSINLRGMNNNRTVVLIDGVRLNNPSSTDGESIGHLIVQDIARIEVIKGAQSGVWGADATAGVINIITKKATKGTKSSFNVEGGSYATKKVGAVVSHREDNYDIKLAITSIQTDSFSVQSPKDDDVSKYEDDAYENLTINLQANYFVTDNATLGFSVTDIDALKEYDNYPDDNTMKSDINTRLYSLSYKQNYKNHNITLKADKSEFKRDEIGTVASPGSTWNGVYYPGSENVKVFNGDITNIELNDKISYREKDFVVLGLGSSSDDVQYTKTDDSKTDKKNSDNYIYLSNSNIFGDFILSGSARYDDYDNFDSKATGKIGARYNLPEDIFVTANVGTAYNVPNIMQELNPWGASNDELNPENSMSYDISFGYKNFKATYFVNEVEDLIKWDNSQYKNLDGKSKFKGFELEYAQDITDDLYLSLNYTQLTAEDKDGKALARRAESQADISATYYVLDNLDVGLNAQYIGKRFDSADKQGEQTGEYTLANFITNYALNDNLSFYAKVDNITDEKYQTVDGYATAERSFYLGLNAKY